jgi:hypothetical protein
MLRSGKGQAGTMQDGTTAYGEAGSLVRRRATTVINLIPAAAAGRLFSCRNSQRPLETREISSIRVRIGKYR